MEDLGWQKVVEWMEKYGNRIIRVVYLLVNDYHLAEEITQEVFIQAYNSLESFRGESSPYTWLYRIALNLSKNYLKRKERISFLPFKEEAGEEDILTEPVEEQVIKLVAGHRVRECVGQLPLAYREVIILYYYDGLKIAEIAGVLEQPVGTVKSKLSRGRELLEKIFRKEGLGDEEGRGV
ncbi:MAG TPA: sigma-70 family RNA polymerase sigma factor [Peptococcaceae bacterium]|nr:sigma-70 family RNA polymerase sigma factor [Peptococcaceae bacterium]